MSEELTKLERLELSWLSRQSHPVWGGHLARGEPVEQTGLARFVRMGVIEEASQFGYRITAKGRAAIREN